MKFFLCRHYGGEESMISIVVLLILTCEIFVLHLSKITPEDVTCCFELQDKKNTELLLAKSGDLITVVSWK